MSSVSRQVVAHAPPLTRKGTETRQTLLDSAISLIASTGYAATTTQAILDHCGLSRGSLLHQFKTRDLLMVATALEAVDRMFTSVQQGLASATGPIEALREYPLLLWRVLNEPPAQAFAELQLASRWEEGLKTALQPVVEQINERIVREIHQIAQENGLRNAKQLIAEVGALISAMQGLAVSSSLITDVEKIEAILEALRGHYQDCLEASL